MIQNLLIIEKWIDDVFVWSSENGSIKLEIPAGWNTPRRYNVNRDSKLTIWKKKHHKELSEFKKLTGDKLTQKKWREDQQIEMDRVKKLKMDILFVILSVWVK